MGWPQITLIAWMAMGVGVAACRDGEATTYSFGKAIVRLTLLAGLLYAGGFFS